MPQSLVIGSRGPQFLYSEGLPEIHFQLSMELRYSPIQPLIKSRYDDETDPGLSDPRARQSLSHIDTVHQVQSNQVAVVLLAVPSRLGPVQFLRWAVDCHAYGERVHAASGDEQEGEREQVLRARSRLHDKSKHVVCLQNRQEPRSLLSGVELPLCSYSIYLVPPTLTQRGPLHASPRFTVLITIFVIVLYSKLRERRCFMFDNIGG
ncbi:hypothetical protein EYF80_053140 [Liparis tanakae]|uniref:Uncharacterized protein n=1 Tax=Liparis tanakae TaxID=230148 RepID=A0A4Z2F6M5_9TELE|nr:hypothetical protein EYF80_053140 [Liparis tanakae]